jgi:hypothetical protein
MKHRMRLARERAGLSIERAALMLGTNVVTVEMAEGVPELPLTEKAIDAACRIYFVARPWLLGENRLAPLIGTQSASIEDAIIRSNDDGSMCIALPSAIPCACGQFAMFHVSRAGRTRCSFCDSKFLALRSGES